MDHLSTMLATPLMMGIKVFVRSATQTSNGSCILGAVVGDSIRYDIVAFRPLQWPHCHMCTCTQLGLLFSIFFFGLISVRTAWLSRLCQSAYWKTWFLGVTHARLDQSAHVIPANGRSIEAQDTHVCLFSHDAVYMR